MGVFKKVNCDIMNKFTSICLIIFAVNSYSAFAYIDPGTGGLILQSFWPFVVSIFAVIAGFIIKHFWDPIKGVFKRK